MKNLLLIAASILCMTVLSGCMTLSETQAPALTEKFSSEAKLHLDGFQLYSVREKQHHVGYSSLAAYNFRTDSWISGGGSYSGSTYERMPDEKFPLIVKDIFETSGANIRTDKPQLTIEGRIGDGHFLWDSAAMWYRDAPLFVLSVCTLGMVISKEREVVVSLLVYNKSGKRIKEYSASEIYYTAGIGFPLALLYTENMRTWYCDRKAAEFALIKCMNEFIRDFNSGFFTVKAVQAGK